MQDRQLDRNRSIPTYVVRGLATNLECWRRTYVWVAERMATYWATFPKLRTTGTGYIDLDQFWLDYANAKFDSYMAGVASLLNQLKKPAVATPSSSPLGQRDTKHALARRTSPPRAR